jgi:hypothetical protein
MTKFLASSKKTLTFCGVFSLATTLLLSLCAESVLAQRVERGIGCRNTPSENKATGSFTINILDAGYTFLSVKADGSFYPDGKGGPLIVGYVPSLSTNVTGRRTVSPQQQSFAVGVKAETLRVVMTSRGPRIDREVGSFIKGAACNPVIPPLYAFSAGSMTGQSFLLSPILSTLDN